MNIQQIKEDISARTGKPLTTLTMVRQFEDEEKTKPAPWVSHWDNENRVRVTMHEDVFNQIKANPKVEGLALKREDLAAEGERKAYVRFVVITPRHIEGTF